MVTILKFRHSFPFEMEEAHMSKTALVKMHSVMVVFFNLFLKHHIYCYAYRG